MNNFKDKLIITNLPSEQQRLKEFWDVEGILNNQKHKFDLRPIKNNCKIGHYKSKADKMVFDIKNQWIIVDVEELHTFLKDRQLKETNLEILIEKLDWNIILPKQ